MATHRIGGTTMDKQQVLAFLSSQNIPYEITEHAAVYNMAEAAAIPMPYPEADAKNLLVRDAKREHYYMITVRGDRRVDLKAFRRQYQTRALSFATAPELMELLGLIPGAVTPLGLLNDERRRVALYLDKAFREAPGRIGVHPNDNTATLWLKTEDLIAIVRGHGNAVHLAEL